MRRLSPEFKPDEGGLHSKLAALSRELKPPEINSLELRERLEVCGFSIRETTVRTPEESKPLLCVDSSYGKLDLKFHSIFCLHCASVYAEFTADKSGDVLVGQGTVPYRSMLYGSRVDAGLIIPYSDTDTRLNLIRLGAEVDFLLSSRRRLEEDGKKTDFLVLDGSLATIKNELNGCGDYPEYGRVKSSLRELSGLRVVSMVEDSHATDISVKAGVELTNLHLLEYVLRPCEYVVDTADDVNVVYVKLPGKSLCFKPGEESRPLVVRWEFNYPDFWGDLAFLAGAWTLEDDLLHPQLYPMRVADYLTRRLKVSGILSEFARSEGLEDKHRNMREI